MGQQATNELVTWSSATGRVYGTVYSGLDSGFAVAAPMFGWMMDHQLHSQVFFGASLALAVSVLAASAVGVQLHHKRMAAQATA